MNGVVEAICRIYANRTDLSAEKRDEWITVLRRYLDGRPLSSGDLRHLNREIRAMQQAGVQDRFTALRDQLKVAESVLHAEGQLLRAELLQRIDLTGITLDRPGAIVVRVTNDVGEKLGGAIGSAVRTALDERGAQSIAVFVIDETESISHLNYPVEDAICSSCRTVFLRRPDVVPVPETCRKCPDTNA